MIDQAQDDDTSARARTVFCGNLSEKVTEEILYELFLQVSGRIGRLDGCVCDWRSFSFIPIHRSVPSTAFRCLKTKTGRRNRSDSLSTDTRSRCRTRCPCSPAPNCSIASYVWIRVKATTATASHKWHSSRSQCSQTVYRCTNFKCTIRRYRRYATETRPNLRWPMRSATCCRACRICHRWIRTTRSIWRCCWAWARS